jgi:hypothetical protein
MSLQCLGKDAEMDQNSSVYSFQAPGMLESFISLFQLLVRHGPVVGADHGVINLLPREQETYRAQASPGLLGSRLTGLWLDRIHLKRLKYCSQRNLVTGAAGMSHKLSIQDKTENPPL